MIRNPFNPLPDGLFSDVSRPVPLSPRQSTDSELILCEVQDVLAYGSSYVVKGNNTPRMVASLGSDQASMMMLGARDVATLIPGSVVLVWCSKHTPPVILCAIALPQGSFRAGLPDSMVPVGNAGLYGDPAHQFVASNPHGQGLIDYSAGKPVDSLPGDWGKLNELGLGFFLGKLMTTARATDLARLDMFYLDNLVRLTSFNWQHYTAGSAEETYTDEGEWTAIKEFNPYAFEFLPAVEQTTEANLSLLGERFGLEPDELLSAPLARMRVFEGYLGDLRRRTVLVPRVKTRQYGTNNDGDDNKYPKAELQSYLGVFDEVIGVDGSYTLKTAKGFSLEKTVWIPVAEQLMPRDHPEGDTEFENPGGRDTTLAQFPPSTNPGDTLAADDREAYYWQKYVSQGLNLRKKDWFVGDDPILPGGFNKESPPSTPYPGFSAPIKPSGTVQVDHRKSVQYFQGKARIATTDDGGIILEDAYGSSIKLVGGNIEISCPGDVIMRAGKRVQNWSGGDFIVKSNKNVEISSANNDVRIKAERNMMILGGNSGSGGTLIEDRSSSTANFTGLAGSTDVGGLTLKASRGSLNVIGTGVHIRSEGNALVLDGEGGDQDIILFGQNLQRYFRRSTNEVIANKEIMEDTPAEEVSMISHTRSNYTISTGTMKLGTSNLTIVNQRSTNPNTNISVKGNLTLEGRGAATLDFTKIQSQSVFGTEAQVHNQIIDTTLSGALAPVADVYLRSDSALGATAENTGFFFPNSDELGLGSMVIFEAPWQKAFRQTVGLKSDDEIEGRFAVHEEPEVFPRIEKNTLQGVGNATMAFPGFKAWTHQNPDRTNSVSSANAFGRYDDVFNATDGSGVRPIPIGEDIEESYDLGLLSSSNEGKFEGNYIINT